MVQEFVCEGKGCEVEAPAEEGVGAERRVRGGVGSGWGLW